MKQIFTLLAAVLLTATTYAQVGIGTINPDASAALDITSTTKGLLPPRMTTAERDAITSAAKGLIVFNTTLNTLQINEGDATTANWVSLRSTTLAIGDSYGGGIIFWLDETGKHGLISATADQSTAVAWHNNGTNIVTNAVRDGIGAGKFNTERIISSQGVGTYAAQIGANYQGGNYDDWYLPSKYELNLMYENIGPGNALGLGNVANFAPDFYWSSTEYDNEEAWYKNFLLSYPNNNSKESRERVRAVRAF